MYTLSPRCHFTRHLPVNDPLVTLRETLVNNPLNNLVFIPPFLLATVSSRQTHPGCPQPRQTSAPPERGPYSRNPQRNRTTGRNG